MTVELKTKNPAQVKSKWIILKNLFLISLSLTLLFTASKSMDNLQSSVHFENRLGIVTLSLTFAFNMFACFFFSAWFIRKFGPKTCLFLSMISYVAYSAANFYGRWYTLLPVAVFQGVSNSVLYASIWTYISNLGVHYVELTGSRPESVNAIFYGLFHMLTQSAVVWGGITSFKVLREDLNFTNHSFTSCGPDFCDANVKEHGSNFSGLPNNFYLLCGIFLSLSLGAMIVVLLLDKQDPSADRETSLCHDLLQTVKKIPDFTMLLLIPITFYAGLTWAYVGGDFTKAYMTCPWGVAYVGYILVCFGVTSAFFSMLMGWTVKVLGRSAVFFLATVTDLAVYASLAWWPLSVTSLTFQFVLSGLLGLTAGVWQGQVKALFGSLFPNYPEVAFSLLGVFESAGISTGYGYSSALCTLPKIYILTGFLLLGMTCYAVIEIRLLRSQKTLKKDSS